MKYAQWVLGLVCTLVITGLVGAADPPPAADGAAASPAATAEFAKLFGELRDSVNSLKQMRDRFRDDPSADKAALEADYPIKVAAAKKLEVKVAAAAERAYLANPNTSSDVDDFLFSFIVMQIDGDQYENAARLTKVLVDHDFKHKAFDYLSGKAYFGNHEFEKSEQALKRAVEKNEIDELGRNLLKQTPAATEQWKKEQEIRKREEKDDNLPKVKLSTSKGDIVVLLYENEAPNTVANFISLVEKKFYDGLTFHRVIPTFMAQGGDPKGNGQGGPEYTIPDECRQANHRNHFGDTLSMAKTPAPDTGGSQFFITFQPTPDLDGKHTVFGRVIEGHDVLAKLTRRTPETPQIEADKINTATVLRKRDHKYEPIKRPDKS